MKRYIDELLAFDALQSAIQEAINRELTETEVRYVKWLARMDYETIDIFIKLFEDTIKK